MKSYKNTFSLLALAPLLACGAETPPEGPEPRERTPVDVQTADPMPPDHPDTTLQIASRGPRRFSVEQLERSVEQIGGLPPGSVDLDASLAQTLGEPDYFRVTEESLEPSPLFMKFMVDLGGFVCNGLSDFDAVRPEEERVLTRYADDEANIRYILLRFTGITGAAADEYVPRLQAVHDAGSASQTRTNGGWEAVCLAVFTSPEFLLY